MWTVVIVRRRQAAARAEMRVVDRLMERDRIKLVQIRLFS
jgi:hypothetical protein